jgi:hypothetical protein
VSHCAEWQSYGWRKRPTGGGKITHLDLVQRLHAALQAAGPDKVTITFVKSEEKVKVGWGPDELTADCGQACGGERPQAHHQGWPLTSSCSDGCVVMMHNAWLGCEWRCDLEV